MDDTLFQPILSPYKHDHDSTGTHPLYRAQQYRICYPVEFKLPKMMINPSSLYYFLIAASLCGTHVSLGSPILSSLSNLVGAAPSLLQTVVSGGGTTGTTGSHPAWVLKD